MLRIVLLARRQRILDGFLESIRRGTDYLNLFVNMFSHARIISCRHFKTTKNLSNALNPLSRRHGPAAARQPGDRSANLLYKPTDCRAALRRGKIVRSLHSAGILVCCACGQDQERKLIDRLLKPDMALQNDAQSKRFAGDGSASINKRSNVGSFYVHQQTSSKNFSGTRDFVTEPLFSRRLTTADAARMRLRHSKQWQIRSLLTQITPRAVFAMRHNRVRRSPLARTLGTGLF